MMKILAGLWILSAILVFSFAVCHAESGPFPFTVMQNGDTAEFDDAATGIKASVSEQTLGDADFQTLREYYNDRLSTDDQLFDKYVNLQRSYIPAMQDLFASTFLYGSRGNPLAESNIKLFYEGADTIFGQPSAVYLYNIFRSNGLQMNEETHLDLSIPSKGTHSLMSIRITLNAGSLNEKTLGKITTLISSVRLDNLPAQSKKLRLFKETDALEAANTGIYPAQSSETPTLGAIEDRRAGFMLSLPYGLVPYMQNSIGGRLQYRSYKINPNHIFSVTAEPMEAESDLLSAVAGIKALEGWKSIKDEGWQNIGAKEFYHAVYDSSSDGIALHISEYFMASHSILYRLKLSSRLEEPSPLMLQEFNGILASFETIEPEVEDLSLTTLSKTYMNKEEGYSFNYPGSWELTDITKNIDYDRLRLVYPELSGPLEITVSEGGWTPYGGSPVKVLATDSRTEGSSTYVYKLLNYLDPNGRNRLTYSVDILNGGKTYSMFVSIGEYETLDGSARNEAVNAMMNRIAASFKAEDTPESLARAAAGETRSKKVLFVEEWLRRKVDPGLKVAAVSDTAADGSIYVQVVDSGEGGYYRVLPNFDKDSLTILNRTLTSVIMDKELQKLENIYKNRIVTGTYVNEADMTLRIDSSTDPSSPVFSRTYRVNVNFSNKGIEWETVRTNHEEDLRRECKVFLYMYVSSDIDMKYDYDNTFKDLASYAAQGMTYRTLVHASGPNMDSFFTLEIDTAVDDIQVVSEKTMKNLLKEIDENRGYARDGYKIAAYSFDSSNFILTLTLESKTGGPAKSEKLKIQYNPEDKTIDYKAQ